MTRPLFREDAYLRTCAAQVVDLDGADVVLDQTVFYPSGGGQPGDRGHLTASGAALAVVDTIKGDEAETIIHRLGSAGHGLESGSTVEAEIDFERRHLMMRMHSALHLLCAAVAEPVTGGQISEGKGRLDFDVEGGKLDKALVQERLDTWIQDDRPIAAHWIDAEELSNRPDLVRTLSVRPPTTGGRVRLVEIEGVDLQACGGTHVRTTGEIGSVTVGKIENKGRQNRRVNLALVL